MKITNLSAEPEGLLRSWLPNDLQAEHIVFLPDACPGKSPLPTGSVVLTRQSDWQRFAVSDCGCGMRLLPGGQAIIPSHMTGDCSLVTGTGKLAEILFSMSHGTGRTMSRAEAKTHLLTYDFGQLFKNVMLPSFLNKNSLTTEGPFAYRELDDCLALISDYVKEIKRFSAVAYMGHL